MIPSGRTLKASGGGHQAIAGGTTSGGSNALAQNRAAAPEALADILLTELTPPAGDTDDMALVLIRL
ncbi:hypothetical protein ACFZCG_18475 [Streptomyces tanashiensis]|uniref:hypothetical protein n=1 Tax=Streptomyces tanashiensis TaxID=67367 RepID=UPI0036E9728A